MASIRRRLFAPPSSVSAAVSPPPHLRLITTNMTVMAYTLGAFFFLAAVCTAARHYYLKRIESNRRNRNRAVPVVNRPILLINFGGLSQSVIDSITVCEYKKREGLIGGTYCSVCLSEFGEYENVRLLPKCSHAFHIPCIDTWLRSHKNCPLCRAFVVGTVPETAQTGRQAVETQIDGPDETET